MQQEYTDETPFPFGKYKGKAMANIPAEYLLYIRQNFNNLLPGIRAYIDVNMQVLQHEASKHKRR